MSLRNRIIIVVAFFTFSVAVFLSAQSDLLSLFSSYFINEPKHANELSNNQHTTTVDENGNTVDEVKSEEYESLSLPVGDQVKEHIDLVPKDPPTDPEPITKELRNAHFQPPLVTAKAGAEAAIQRYFDYVGEDNLGPTIVGGIGDSGTRGVYYLLSRFGLDMCKNSQYTMDSRLWMHPYTVVNETSTEQWNAGKVYMSGIRGGHNLQFTPQTMTDQKYYKSQQWIAKTALMHVAFSTLKGGMKVPVFWGWKHPRTSLLINMYSTVFRGKFRFVHVVRDGRESATGHNKNMYRSLCDDYYGIDCGSTLERRLRFWADLNREVFNIAKATLSPDQYMILRIEDVVNKKEPCFHQVLEFLGVAKPSKEELDNIMEDFYAFRKSYNGLSRNENQHKDSKEVLEAHPDIAEQFRFFGYSLDEYGTKESCVDMRKMHWT